jgi:hypothetical protein
MPVQFLDLDPIGVPAGRVRIQGQEYEVWPIQVGTVINLTVETTAGSTNGHTTFGDQLNQSVAILQQLIPTCPVSVLHTLTLEQLNTLMEWAREVAYSTVEKNSPAPIETETLSPPSTSGA